MPLKLNYPQYASGLKNKIQAAINEATEFEDVQNDPDVHEHLKATRIILRGALQRTADLMNGKTPTAASAFELYETARKEAAKAMAKELRETHAELSPKGETIGLGDAEYMPDELIVFAFATGDGLTEGNVTAIGKDAVVSVLPDGSTVETPVDDLSPEDLKKCLIRLGDILDLIEKGSARIENNTVEIDADALR